MQAVRANMVGVSYLVRIIFVIVTEDLRYYIAMLLDQFIAFVMKNIAEWAIKKFARRNVQEFSHFRLGLFCTIGLGSFGYFGYQAWSLSISEGITFGWEEYREALIWQLLAMESLSSFAKAFLLWGCCCGAYLGAAGKSLKDTL